MGIRAMKFVKENRRAGGFAQAVLAYLADCMNDRTGRCFPLREKIAEYFSSEDDRCTVKRVERALARLRTLGFIESKRVPYTRQTAAGQEGGWQNSYVLVGFIPGDSNPVGVTNISGVTPKTDVTPAVDRGHPQNVQGVTPTVDRGHPHRGGIKQKELEENKKERESSMRTSGTSSAIAAVASAQAQMLPTSFSQSSNSQNHSEAGIAGKDSLSNASERSVAAHRDRLDASDEQTLQNDAGCSQNASTRISGVCPENEPPPMSDEDLENLFADAQLDIGAKAEEPTGKTKRKRSSNAQKPESVSGQVWNDFSALRAKRRAPITETALKGIQREAEKAGITLEEALSTCCERGWQGFKAEWYRREKLEQKNASKAEYQLPSNDDWDNFDTAHYA